MSNYKSPSTGEGCSPAQYITELLLTRKAKSDGKTLPYKFWNIAPHKLEYRKQIHWVNSLLKLHDHRAVIAALVSKEGEWMYSTASPKLDVLIHEQELKMKRMEEQEVIKTKETGKPMKTFGTKSILNKLDE